jgi:hypothetical protein
MVENINKGVVNGEVINIEKEKIQFKNGGHQTKYKILLKQTKEWNGKVYEKLSLIEYIRKEESADLNSLKAGYHITCEFTVETTKYLTKDGVEKYWTIAKGIGNIKINDTTIPYNDSSEYKEDNKDYDDIPF